MPSPTLPFSLPGCVIDAIRTVDFKLLIVAHTISESAQCPRCHHASTHTHSHYLRTVRDLPISDWTASLLLQVRRFRCRQPGCPQQTFAERLPELVPYRAQRTIRFTHRLYGLALASSGEAGARVARQAKLPTSPDTLLRIIRAIPSPAAAAPRVLGVDDFALQKGHIYGSILVDLEQRQPVDLLPDRTADTFATWLRGHPGVGVIARDRSTEYARGATAGAPAAIQVADRWHILKNHREALERMLNRLHADLSRMLVSGSPTTPPSSNLVQARLRPLRMPSRAEHTARQASHARRMQRYQQVRTLVAQGHSILQIATQLGMSRTTVTAFARATTFPERAIQPGQASILDPYTAYLTQRWAEGETNASQLWRELQTQGYAGIRKQVARWVQTHRTVPAAAAPKKYGFRTHRMATTSSTAAAATPALAAPRQLVWLLLHSPSQLNAEDAALLVRLQQHPDVCQAQELAQVFQAMVRQQRPEAFDGWLNACAVSGISELQSFAKGLAHEDASIRAALCMPWSSGQVEGQVTRLKLIKRQMYGRAKFDLLRQRVLGVP
jgi:transposase